MNMYRYIDKPNDDDFTILSKVILVEYDVIRETRCGFWIEDKQVEGMLGTMTFYRQHKKWVSKLARIKFAYPTKAEALNNFIKRKEKQVHIYKHRLALAESALAEGKKINP